MKKKHKQSRSNKNRPKTRSSDRISDNSNSYFQDDYIQIESTGNESNEDAHNGPNENQANKESGIVNDGDTVLYCYPDCTQGRLYDRQLIQCSSCMSWLHTDCTDAGSEPPAIWICKKCRCMPDTVNGLKDQLSEIHDVLSAMLNTQTEMQATICEIIAKNCKLESNIKILKQQNQELRMRCYNRFNSSSSDSSDSSGSNYPCDSDSETGDPIKLADVPSYTQKSRRKKLRKTKKDMQQSETKLKSFRQPKVTVLGGSMVRNIGSIISSNMKSCESCVYSTSGLTINDASEQAKTIFDDHKKGDVTILQVGTSDLQNKTEQELVENYNALIDTVKRTAPAARHVITAVPHRMDTGSTALNQKADYLNAKLRQKCDEDPTLSYIDANPTLSKINYNSDSLHFNYYRRSYFAKYLCNYISHSANFPQFNALLNT